MPLEKSIQTGLAKLTKPFCPISQLEGSGRLAVCSARLAYNRQLFRILGPISLAVAAIILLFLAPRVSIMREWYLLNTALLGIVALGFSILFWANPRRLKQHQLPYVAFSLLLIGLTTSISLREFSVSGNMGPFVAGLLLLNLLLSANYWAYGLLCLVSYLVWVLVLLWLNPALFISEQTEMTILYNLIAFLLGITMEGQRRRSALVGSQLARANRALRQLSITDPLTGAYNRRFLEETLEHLLQANQRKSREMTIFFVDLDHFKLVNDTFGHDTGDRTLQDTVSCLRACLRRSDLIARWGGEEFVVMLPDTGLGTARLVAERIRHKRASIPINGHDTVITLSIGMTCFFPGDSLISLVDRADQALYRAKNQGRNQCVVIEGLS